MDQAVDDAGRWGENVDITYNEREHKKEKNIYIYKIYIGFPCGSAGKESTCNVGNLGSIPGLGRSLEEGKATHSSTLT